MEKVVERKAKDLRVGDIVLRRGHELVISKIEPYRSGFISVFNPDAKPDRFIISYANHTHQDDLYKSSTVKSKTRRRLVKEVKTDITSLIFDESEVKKFYESVIMKGDRSPFDVDFFCVAARKKYMTQEERELTQLGDTCMMEKTVCREEDYNIFLHKLQKVDACLDHLYSHNGTNIPKSCMVLYMNINHTSMIEALKSLKIDIALLESELYDVFIKNGLKEGVGNKLKRLDNLVLKAYQNPKNMAKKTWVDLDVDIPTDKVPADFIRSTLDEMLLTKGVAMFNLSDNCQITPIKSEEMYTIIRTHGGYHILVNTRNISKMNEDYSSTIRKIDKKRILSVQDFIVALKEGLDGIHVDAKEIKINPNSMVPIPGTLQGGFEVRIA